MAELQNMDKGVATPTTPLDQTSLNTTINDTDDEYRDGGRHAWLVVLGAWCAMFPAMGLLNTLAVLEAHLAGHELRAVPRTQSAWIFSSYAFFLYFCGAQVGPLFDAHDVRGLIITGSVGMVAALLCLSFSTRTFPLRLLFY